MEESDGRDDPGQWLADSGCLVGADGRTAAASAEPPAGLPQPTRPGPGRPGWDLLHPTHRQPVGRAERHRHLFEVLGSPALHRVGGSGSVPRVLAPGAAGLRRGRRDRLEVAVGRWGDDQGALGWGKKPAPTRPTGASWGPSARWLPTPAACP